MKKISFMIAALLVAMTGCQKEPQANPENNPGSNAEGVGYVALKISLPSSVGTKADTNFDDGDAREYAVSDLAIVFFDVNGKYAFHTTDATPDPWNTQNPSTDNITYSGKTPAIPVTNPAAKNALVLINYGVVLPGSLENKDYEDIIAAVNHANLGNAATDAGDNPYFFMSNAPYNYQDGCTTLVPVEVMPTEAQALLAAAEVKVERASAKIQVNYEGAIVTGDYGTAEVLGWDLDVTNKTMYPVRQIELGWLTNNNLSARIQGNSGRIYWAVDPNYSTNYVKFDNTQFNRITDVDGETFTLHNGGIAYCLENTFNTLCMDENQTTTVMIKAKYTPSTTTLGTDGTWFMVGSGKTVYNTDALINYIIEKVTAMGGNCATGYDNLEVAKADFKTRLESKSGTVSNFRVDEQSEIMLNDAVGEVICYKGGICYYPVKVRHFTNDELNYTSDEFQTRFKESGYDADLDLGRYGVLRNTWYKITVNKIENPGSPVIPDPTDTPDDKFEQYVACTIDILAWSVRNHSVDL